MMREPGASKQNAQANALTNKQNEQVSVYFCRRLLQFMDLLWGSVPPVDTKVRMCVAHSRRQTNRRRICRLTH